MAGQRVKQGQRVRQLVIEDDYVVNPKHEQTIRVCNKGQLLSAISCAKDHMHGTTITLCVTNSVLYLYPYSDTPYHMEKYNKWLRQLRNRIWRIKDKDIFNRGSK